MLARDTDLLGSTPKKFAVKLVLLAAFSVGAVWLLGAIGIPFIAAFTGLVFATEFRELLTTLFFRVPRAYLRSAGNHRVYVYCGSSVRTLQGGEADALWFHEQDVLAALCLTPPNGLARMKAHERQRGGEEGEWYLSRQGLEYLLRYHVKGQEASRFRTWLDKEVFRVKTKAPTLSGIPES